MTLGEHLDELRGRLIRSTIALLLAFSVLYGFRDEVSKLIQQPYRTVRIELNEVKQEVLEAKVAKDPEVRELYFRDEGGQSVLRESAKFPPGMQSLSPGGPFAVKIYLCFWLSLFVAGPYILWEVWMFIAAGLYKQEKSVVYSYLPISIALFIAGVVFGFLVMFPAALYFTQADGLGTDDIGRNVEFSFYLQLMRSLTLAIGLVFQVPLIQVALSRLGLVHPRTYAKYRGHMAIITLVVAAIVTPPDPMTQLILAGPAILLWEIGLWCARLAWREPVPLDEVDLPPGAAA